MLLALQFAAVMAFVPANAQRISFRSFSQGAGLEDLSVHCLKQNQEGFIFACSENGLYFFDGTKFSELGERQGLPSGGYVRDLVFAADGRIVVRFGDRVFVSRQGDVAEVPDRLSFTPAVSSVGPLYDDTQNGMTRWKAGVLMVDRSRLLFIDPGGRGRAATISPAPLPTLTDGSSIGPVYSVGTDGGDLLIGAADGRICVVAGRARCVVVPGGPEPEQWETFLAEGSHRFAVRSSTRLVQIDTRSLSVVAETLPDQTADGQASYTVGLGLIRTPSGAIMTQTPYGLIVGDGRAWKVLDAANGLPGVPIPAMAFDRTGDLWISAFGLGIMQALGYGQWESWDQRDGLSSNVVWEIARQPDGPLYIATEAGVDRFTGRGSIEPATSRFRSAAYELAFGIPTHLWQSLPDRDIAMIDTGTGIVERFPLPTVNGIVRGDGDRVWIATTRGLFSVDDRPGDPGAPIRRNAQTDPITTIAAGRSGELWCIRLGQLWHRYPDGHAVAVPDTWKGVGFEPMTLTLDHDDRIWVGGSTGGARLLTMSGDRVTDVRSFGTAEIQSQIAVAVMVDHRGWAWVGTDKGVSVFDGHRWVTAGAGDGMVSDDVDEGGLYEDVDGTIWVGTSLGLAHLLHPERLFEQSPPMPVVEEVSLGGEPFPQRAAPFSREPVHIAFGAPNARPGVRFRYQLEGVDRGWSETSLSGVRYASIPPGKHRFFLVAVDPRTHQVSEPVSVTLAMQEPWWLWWPTECGYAAAFFAALYAAWRIRYGYLLSQRKALSDEVDRQMCEIRAAQEALRAQASLDSLTGLLNRGEIQRRLGEALAENRPVAIGLLDIDHFKRINDHFGHLAGDDVLVELGRRTRACMRDGELSGRYGGEEVLLMVEAGADGGVARIRDIRHAVCHDPFLIENELVRVTCSIGAARSMPQDSWKSLVGRADRALYQAKADGRDRVVVAQPTGFEARKAPLTAIG